jgi:phenylacetate-CoA ligase
MPGLRTAFVTRVVDPVIWKRKGTPIGSRLAEFRARQWDDAEALAARQASLLVDLLSHAIVNVPFYRERAQGLTRAAVEADPFVSLRSFPILEREDVRDRLEQLVVETGRGTIRDHTSGSTGMPIDFVRDRPSITASFASTLLAYEWAGLERGERRTRFWGPAGDVDAAKSRLRRLADAFHDRTVVRSLQLDDEHVRGYIGLLNARPPVSLEGDPEALYRIADLARRLGLSVPRPRTIIVGGATVYDHMRRTYTEVFGAPVFVQYGNREEGLLAAECECHRGLHVMGETTVLEVVSDDGAPAGAGEYGSLIATHLWNHSMPFIRYRTGDRGALSSEPCACGRPYPLLERVTGRTGESFARRDGGLVIPDAFVKLLAWEFRSPDVRRFQVVQEAVDRIVVRVVPQGGAAGYSDDARREIAQRIGELMGESCAVEFVTVDEVESSRSGKYFYTISNVNATGQRRSDCIT